MPFRRRIYRDEWCNLVEALCESYGTSREEQAGVTADCDGFAIDYTEEGGRVEAVVVGGSSFIDWCQKVVFNEDGTVHTIADSGEMRTIWHEGEPIQREDAS